MIPQSRSHPKYYLNKRQYMIHRSRIQKKQIRFRRSNQMIILTVKWGGLWEQLLATPAVDRQTLYLKPTKQLVGERRIAQYVTQYYFLRGPLRSKHFYL